MDKRSGPAHAREQPPQLRSEDVLASERWQARVGSGPVAEAPLERVPERSIRARIARAVKAPVLAGVAVFVLAVLVTIGIVAASSLGDQMPDHTPGSVSAEDAGDLSARGADGADGADGSGGAVTPLADRAGTAAEGAVSAEEAAVIYVHVVGEVAQAGVVELPVGARVQEAIKAAGGATKAAVLSEVNLARQVTDGEQLVVPDAAAVEAWLAAANGNQTSAGVASASSAAATGAGTADASSRDSAGHTVVNLNTADAVALETLPRVGPALAERIIDWRTQNGAFTSIDQLLDISGIGAKTLAGFRDQVTV